MAEKRELRQRGRGGLRRGNTERGKKRRRRKKKKKKKKEGGDSRCKEAPVALPAEGKSVDLLPFYARTQVSQEEKGKYPSLSSLLMTLGYTKGGYSLEGSDKGCRGG